MDSRASQAEAVPAAGAHRPVSPRALRRSIGAATVGNAVEWFDYGIYAYGVTYISGALLPGTIQEATLLALGTFAISFLVRPLGGLFWGPLGDRIGRRSVLAVTIVMMSLATVCIGLIPSYAAIGAWAPALLVLFRLIQGFSTGGEYGGAATFLAETAPAARRGFFGSFLEFGTLAGFLAGASLMLGCSVLLGEDAMHDWGWRLPFMIAAPLGLVGVYLRSHVEETPVFGEIRKKREHAPRWGAELKVLFANYPRQLLTLGGMVIALNVVNYTLISYTPTYLSTHLGLSAAEALLVPIASMLLMMVLLPVFGALSDRVGRKPLWWGSLAGLFVLAVPLYQMMATGSVGAVLGLLLLGILYVPQLATISATFPAMFPTPVRYAGFAIAYNVSTALFGGTAPMFNAWLISASGSTLVPAYTMMAACIPGMLSLLFLIETAGSSLRGTAIPGTGGANSSES